MSKMMMILMVVNRLTTWWNEANDDKEIDDRELVDLVQIFVDVIQLATGKAVSFEVEDKDV